MRIFELLKKCRRGKAADLKPNEFDDVVKVLEMGAKKYGPRDWEKPEGSTFKWKKRCDSAFHHLSEVYVGKTKDDESGLHPALHLAANALMIYTRWKRGLDNNEKGSS